MGKAKPSPKKDAAQKKISSFFTKGAKITSSSNLFSHVSSRQSSSKATSSKSASSNPCRKTTTTTSTTPIVINDDNVDIIDDSPLPKKTARQKTPLQLATSSVTPTRKDMSDTSDCEIIADTPVAKSHISSKSLLSNISCISEAVQISDHFADVLPDTPDSDITLPVAKRKLLQNRSFLSSSNVLKTGGGPVVKKGDSISNSKGTGRVIKTAQRSSTSEKLGKTLPGPNQTWDNSNPNFNAILTENGLPSIAHSAGVSVLNDKVKKSESVAAANVALRGKMIADASKKAAAVKRAASSSTGESPERKKSSKATTRLKDAKSDLNQSNISNKVSEEAVYFVPETQDVGAEMEQEEEVDIDKPRKTFQWQKKTAKSKSMDTSSKQQSVKDEVLSDILNEMKDEVGLDIPKTDSIKVLKRPKRTTTPKLVPENNAQKTRTLTSAENLETLEANEKFADDALLDIMGELKESLTKQNQLSAQAKKVGRPFQATKKPFCRKLNLGGQIKKEGQNDEIKKEDIDSHLLKNKSPEIKKLPLKLKKEPKSEEGYGAEKKLVAGLFSAESSQSSLDPLVAENKAGCLLMEDDSWLEDIDWEAEEKTPKKKDYNLLSPQKDSGNDGKYRSDQTLPPVHAFGRHKVLDIQTVSANETLLTVERATDNATRQLRLKGSWCDTQVEVGDVLHVIGEEESAEPSENAKGQRKKLSELSKHQKQAVTVSDSQVVTVSDNDNKLIILNPDLLISSTSVVSSVHCVRRAVLNEKFKGCDKGNIYMLHGSIIHAFFQDVLKQQAFSRPAMAKVALSVLRQPKFLGDMYGQGQNEAAVREEIEKCFPMMEKFVARHVKTERNMRPSSDIVIENIADIEENVWSPRFGVKGKIDLTVKVKLHSERGKTCVEKLMPLELKTGKASYSIEHKGQVTLYSMMFSDRRDDPHAGLLLYLKEADMKTIPANHMNKRGLIQLRNELAFYLSSSMKKQQQEDKETNKEKYKEKQEKEKCTEKVESWPFGHLPPPINNPRWCDKCPQLLNCAAYQKSVEKVAPAPQHAMSQLIPEALQHLSDVHLDYYTYWLHLLHLEAGTCHARKIGISELWCSTGWEREQKGECLSGMQLQANQCRPHENDRFLQVFSRHPGHISACPMEDVGINAGDNLVVSAENQPLIALSMGFVHQLSSDGKVTLLLDRDLRPYTRENELIFRLDKADTYNSMAVNFTNISRLMENTVHCEKLRQLIVERRAPEFNLTLSKSALQSVKPIFKSLNRPQKTAILKALMCRDYVQIKGYPGTGKTSTIVALVQILVSLGQSVLLTSYTHSAVDNILLKLCKHNVDFVRLGRLERIHNDIKPYSAELLTKDITSTSQLGDFYSSKPVVATTCLGTTHPLFQQRLFDVCIVDEASQVLQPACFGPLFVSSKFVLVGDPLQLPPVVQSPEARDLGMSDSLFARLDDTGGTYELNLQYRMNSAIQRLSNELVYDGALQCGSDVVANSKLCFDQDSQHWQSLSPWIQEALDGSEVQFLDTDAVVIESTEVVKESGIKSVLEGRIVLKLICALVKANIPPESIGIISPYREQVNYLRDLTQKAADLTQFPGLRLVEVNTVDQYQGRDKSVIIVSFVKGKDCGPASGILRDVRRLNVALTRAKEKLLLVGSKQGLMQYPPFVRIFQILQQQQIISLPVSAAEEN